MEKLKRESALPGALSSPTSDAGHPHQHYTPVSESSARPSSDQSTVYSQSALQLVTSLGPDRLYLLSILVLIGGSVLQARLEAITRWSANTVLKHLRGLEELQFVVRQGHRGGWVATGQARQLRLGEVLYLEPSTVEGSSESVGESWGEAGEPEAHRFPDSTANPQRVRVQPSTVEGSDHLVSSSSYRDLNPEETDQLLLDLAQPSPTEGSQDDSTLYDPFAVLGEYGIGEPKRSQLAKQRIVTADYIDAHCSRVIADGKDIALAIHRMEQGWAPGRVDERYLSAGGKRRAEIRFAKGWGT